MWWIVAVVLVVLVIIVVVRRNRSRGTGRGGPWQDPHIEDSVFETHERHRNHWRDFGAG